MKLLKPKDLRIWASMSLLKLISHLDRLMKNSSLISKHEDDDHGRVLSLGILSIAGHVHMQ